MKNFSVFLTGIVCLLLSIPSFASFFEVCDVTAKVVSIEELSVFGKGSRSVPPGVNPDGQGVYSFVNLLNLEILDVKAEVGSHRDCKQMMDKTHNVVLDSKDLLPGVKAGDELKLQRTQNNSRVANGSAYSETWVLR